MLVALWVLEAGGRGPGRSKVGTPPPPVLKRGRHKHIQQSRLM